MSITAPIQEENAPVTRLTKGIQPYCTTTVVDGPGDVVPDSAVVVDGVVAGVVGLAGGGKGMGVQKSFASQQIPASGLNS